MSFGWSVGDVVLAVQLLNKVRIGLKDSGGARSEYQEETTFLEILSTNLRTLASIDMINLSPDVGENIKKNVLEIRGPVDAFKQTIQSRFGTTLGNFSTRSGVISPVRKLRWALSASREVKALRSKIREPLSSLQICLSGNILRLCAELPLDMQRKLETTLRSQLERQTIGLSGHINVHMKSQSADLAASIQSIKEWIQTWDGRAIGVIQECLRDATRSAEFNDPINLGVEASGYLTQIPQILDGVMQLNLRRQNTEPSAGSNEPSLTGQSHEATMEYTRFIQSLGHVRKGILGMINAAISIVGFYLVALYTRLLEKLFARHQFLRIRGSLENGVGLVDALGRSSILPFDCAQSWDIFERTLRGWFHNCPGGACLGADMYCLVDTTSPSKFLNRRTWQDSLKVGMTIQMSAVLPLGYVSESGEGGNPETVKRQFLKGAVELPSIDVHSLVQSMNLLTLFTPTRHRKIPKSDLPALKYVRWIQLDSNSGSPGVEDDATRHTSVRKGFHVDGMYGRKFREAFGGIGPTPEMYPWLYFRRIANQSAQDSILIMVKHRKTCSILDGGPADFPYRGKTISILPMPQDVGKSRTLELVGIR